MAIRECFGFFRDLCCILIGMVLLGEVAGRNAQTIRRDAGARLEDFAQALLRYGIKWSTGGVGDFEGGRTAPDLRTLFVVVAALNDIVTDRTVTIADLFAGTGRVQMNKGLSVPLSSVRTSLEGKPPSAPKLPRTAGADEDLSARVLAHFTETDQRVCKRIGVTNETGATAMAQLWRRTFRSERDHRAGAQATRQRRGGISRKLQDELKKAIK
jgi:hypothetical protein